MATEKKLTPRQAEAMSWLIGGWQPYVQAVTIVYVNGRKLCNIDTMAALMRRGFVEKNGPWQFRITEEGRRYMQSLTAAADRWVAHAEATNAD